MNHKQQAAAAHINGPMMVLAGPGSGKTAVIVARAAHLVEKNIVPADRILVIAYSRSAATEMKRRFAMFFEAGKVPGVTFGTFHSVFYRMLRGYKGKSIFGFNLTEAAIVSENERRGVVRANLAEVGYDADEEMLSALLSEMSLVRNELFDMDHYHSANVGDADFKRVFTRYEDYKTQNGKIDFDDMLCHTYALLQNEPSVLADWRKRGTYIMIDEFQDINKVQYEAVKLLAAPANNLFVVGDDDQSIYRFRGSRPEFLLHFPRDYPETKQVTLDINYRSTDPVIRFANAVIAVNEQRYPKEITGTGRNGPPPVLLKSIDQNQEAQFIGGRIRQMIKDGADPNEIAVAFRLNIQARALSDAFLNMNIPFRTRDEIPMLYEHWIAEDIFSYLRLAISMGVRRKGYDPDAVRIANKPYRFIAKAFLEGLRKKDLDLFEAYQRDRTLHIAQRSRLEELHIQLKSLQNKNTTDAIRFIRRQIGYNQHILDHCAYRRLDPAGLMELADELQEAAKAHPSPEGFLAHAANNIAAKSAEAPAGPCVTLTTLHSAKGLEFERVFIAGAVEEVLPHIRSKTPEEIEEERRLLYVGVTRAKKELFLSIIKTRYDRMVEPSRFIHKLI